MGGLRGSSVGRSTEAMTDRSTAEMVVSASRSSGESEGRRRERDRRGPALGEGSSLEVEKSAGVRGAESRAVAVETESTLVKIEAESRAVEMEEWLMERR